MKKIIEGLLNTGRPSKRSIRSMFKRKKKKNIICYVLITCGEAKKDGTMDVDMRFEGDRSLADYLIKSAYHMLET